MGEDRDRRTTPPVIARPGRARSGAAVAPPPPVFAPAELTPPPAPRPGPLPIPRPAVPVIAPPPMWLELLAIPIATRGRRILLFVLAFIVSGILALNGIIEKYKPAENDGSLIIDTSTGRPIAVPPDMPHDFEPPRRDRR